LDYTHFRAIHRHLFQDVYDWAGEARTVRISKDNSMFCYPENIESEAICETKGRQFLAGSLLEGLREAGRAIPC
jgi:cell filamentation protein